MDGYYGRPRNLTVPVNGAVIAKAASLAASQRARREAEPRNDYRRDDQPRNDPRRDDTRRDTRASGPIDIPSGTQLNLRLTSQIDSKRNHAGDRFTAEVTTPGAYEGAVRCGSPCARADRVASNRPTAWVTHLAHAGSPPDAATCRSPDLRSDRAG